MSPIQPIPAPVSAAFDDIALKDRQTLHAARALILDVAADDPRIGPIDETLRWGEPAYLTTQSQSGSTIRLAIEKQTGKPAMFFNCRTTLIEEFRQKFGVDLEFSKNRAIILDDDIETLTPKLIPCIAAAFIYHLK